MWLEITLMTIVPLALMDGGRRGRLAVGFMILGHALIGIIGCMLEEGQTLVDVGAPFLARCAGITALICLGIALWHGMAGLTNLDRRLEKADGEDV